MLAVYDGTEYNENRVIRKNTKEVGIDKQLELYSIIILSYYILCVGV